MKEILKERIKPDGLERKCSTHKELIINEVRFHTDTVSIELQVEPAKEIHEERIKLDALERKFTTHKERVSCKVRSTVNVKVKNYLIRIFEEAEGIV